MASALEQQLDALIAKHGLNSITLTRIRMEDGTSVWAVYAQGQGMCGSNRGTGDGLAHDALADALAALNAKRAAAVVPELAALADEPLIAEAA